MESNIIFFTSACSLPGTWDGSGSNPESQWMLYLILSNVLFVPKWIHLHDYWFKDNDATRVALPPQFSLVHPQWVIAHPDCLWHT